MSKKKQKSIIIREHFLYPNLGKIPANFYMDGQAKYMSFTEIEYER